MNWVEIPNLRHLRAVEAIARLGSVSRASAHINVSQPAVTQAIAKLEAELGITLFDRRATGSFPTDFGKIFVRRVARFFAMADRALEDLHASYGEQHPQAGRSIEHVVTWTQIRSLIATTDPNEVEQRAREIGVSSGSLYRSARELEQALEIPLFKRCADGTTTNEAGTEFARRLAVATREIEYGLEEVVAAQGRAGGSISIGVLPMSGSFPFGEAITALLQHFPGVQIKILDGNYVSLLGRLRSGQIDLIFGLLHRGDTSDDLIEEEMFEDVFRVVVRHGHPLTELEAPTPAQLAQYEWIASAPGTFRRRVIDEFFADLASPPLYGIETSSLAVTRTLLAGSDRVSILSRSEFEQERNSGRLDDLPVTVGQSLSKGITMRADWLPTPMHVRFIEVMRQVSNEHLPRMVYEASLSPRFGHADILKGPTKLREPAARFR